MAAIQITHSGAKTNRSLTGGVLMGPSDVAVPVVNQTLEQPIPMSEAEIDKWCEWFVSASGRALQAGFDLVEIHAAHGYGLNQWISPITNKRSDFHSFNLLYKIVANIKKVYPQLRLSVRMPGCDFSPEGLTVDDSIIIAKNLESLGVDILHISSGIGGWKRGARVGEGYLVEEASIIKSHVKIPIIGVGGIETYEYIINAVNANLFDYAAVGRAILKNPEAFKSVSQRLFRN